jgi:hypothetical protein
MLLLQHLELLVLVHQYTQLDQLDDQFVQFDQISLLVVVVVVFHFVFVDNEFLIESVHLFVV